LTVKCKEGWVEGEDWRSREMVADDAVWLLAVRRGRNELSEVSVIGVLYPGDSSAGECDAQIYAGTTQGDRKANEKHRRLNRRASSKCSAERAKDPRASNCTRAEGDRITWLAGNEAGKFRGNTATRYQQTHSPAFCHGSTSGRRGLVALALRALAAAGPLVVILLVV
jgi:hypothetical protein